MLTYKINISEKDILKEKRLILLKDVDNNIKKELQ